MKILQILPILLGALLASATANAQSREPHLIHFIGTGTLSCGEFIKYKEESNNDQLDLFVQWSWGFMSAYSLRANFVPQWRGVSKTGDLGRMPDRSTVLLFLEKHCRERPLDNVLAATVALTKALGGNIVWKQ